MVAHRQPLKAVKPVSDLEMSLMVVALVLVGLAIVVVATLFLRHLFNWGGDSELQELDKEVQDLRHDADQAGRVAAKESAAVSALARHTRYARRTNTLRDQRILRQEELDALTGGAPGGAGAGGGDIPPPPPIPE